MPAEESKATAPENGQQRGYQARRELVRTLLVNAVAPYLVYVLCKPHTGGFVALALSAAPPAIESLWSVALRKRIDVMAFLVLGGIAISLGLMALGGSERMLLLRESLVTSVAGLILAASVMLPKPLVYLLAAQMMVGRDPHSGTRLQTRWNQDPHFRRSMRVISLVWGIGLMGEMAVRTVMVIKMEIDHFLLVSPFVQYGLTGLLVLWTLLYRRRLAVPSEHKARDAG
jgi:hypothetical protein